MDFQKLLTDAQAKADANGDSKLTADDIQALASQYGLDQSLVDGLKEKGDVNGDGTVNIEDLKEAASQFNLGGVAEQAQGVLGDLKNKLFGSNDAK